MSASSSTHINPTLQEQDARFRTGSYLHTPRDAGKARLYQMLGEFENKTHPYLKWAVVDCVSEQTNYLSTSDVRGLQLLRTASIVDDVPLKQKEAA